MKNRSLMGGTLVVGLAAAAFIACGSDEKNNGEDGSGGQTGTGGASSGGSDNGSGGTSGAGSGGDSTSGGSGGTDVDAGAGGTDPEAGSGGSSSMDAGPPLSITCSGSGVTSTVGGNTREHRFTEEECGGTLPDDTFRGAIIKSRHCGATDWAVINAIGSETPGVLFTSGMEVCAESLIEVTYFDMALTRLKLCQSSETGLDEATGVQTYTYVNANCTGMQAPPSNMIGGIASRRSCGADDWTAHMTPDISYNVRNGTNTCPRRQVGTFYVDGSDTGFSDVILCQKNGTVSAAGHQSVTFSDSDCARGSLPPDGSVGLLRRVVASGIETDIVIRNPGDQGGPGAELSTTGTSMEFGFQVLYLVP